MKKTFGVLVLFCAFGLNSCAPENTRSALNYSLRDFPMLQGEIWGVAFAAGSATLEYQMRIAETPKQRSTGIFGAALELTTKNGGTAYLDPDDDTFNILIATGSTFKLLCYVPRNSNFNDVLKGDGVFLDDNGSKKSVGCAMGVLSKPALNTATSIRRLVHEVISNSLSLKSNPSLSLKTISE